MGEHRGIWTRKKKRRGRGGEHFQEKGGSYVTRGEEVEPKRKNRRFRGEGLGETLLEYIAYCVVFLLPVSRKQRGGGGRKKTRGGKRSERMRGPTTPSPPQKKIRRRLTLGRKGNPAILLYSREG